MPLESKRIGQLRWHASGAGGQVDAHQNEAGAGAAAGTRGARPGPVATADLSRRILASDADRRLALSARSRASVVDQAARGRHHRTI